MTVRSRRRWSVVAVAVVLVVTGCSDDPPERPEAREDRIVTVGTFEGVDDWAAVAVGRDDTIYATGQFGATVVAFPVKAEPRLVVPERTPTESEQSKPIAVDPRSGRIYYADIRVPKVFSIDADGNVATVAGTGEPGLSGDGGPATQAQIEEPIALAVDPRSGDLYIADNIHDRIRRVDNAGVITTVAGNGDQFASGDGGPATMAGMNPEGLAFDARSGSLYVADGVSGTVRRIDSSGVITTVAGNGQDGSGGDGGPATMAQMTGPVAVAVHSESGSIYVADLSEGRIRRIEASGSISTIAGGGKVDVTADDQPALRSDIAPLSVAVDRDGNVYFTTGERIVVVGG